MRNKKIIMIIKIIIKKTITILFYVFPTFAFWLAVELTYLPFKVTKVLYKSSMYGSELTNKLKTN